MSTPPSGSNATIGDLDAITLTMNSLVEVEESGVSGKNTLQAIKNTFNNSWARLTAQIQAPAGGAPATGQVSMGMLLCLLNMASTGACRLRLYASVAERNADQSRDVTTDPPPGTGCVFEGSTTSSLLSFNCAPIPTIQNNENPVSDLIAYTLEPGTTDPVTVTLTYQVFQS